MGDDSGLSLIEVVVALTVFAFLASAAAVGLMQATKLTATNRDRTLAVNAAHAQLEYLRSLDVAQVPAGLTLVNVPGTKFVLRQTASWLTTSAGGSACDAGVGALAYLRVAIAATWPDMGSTPPIEADTLLTPKVAAYSDATGNLAVRLFDSGAGAADNTLVTISGPGGTRTVTSDDDGCAFFGFLTPGDWTVNLNTFGYVEQKTMQTAYSSPAVGVTAATTTPYAVTYDRVATLVLTTPQPGYAPIQPSVTLANTQLGFGSGILTKNRPSVGDVQTFVNVFPFPTGIAGWTGSCDANDPAVARQPSPGLTPGETSNGLLDGEPVSVIVQKLVGAVWTAQPGLVPVATHANAPGCTTTPSRVLSLPATSGATVDSKVLLPYGTWAWTVTGKTLAPSSPTSSVFAPDGSSAVKTVTLRIN